MTAAYPVPLRSSGPARCARAFPGDPGQVPRARAFAARALAGCPAQEALLACLSELAANAIAHTASGAGGSFTVEVSWPAAGVARVAVTDAGGPAEPAASAATAASHAGQASLAESGRGLLLVAAFSSRWGYREADSGAGRTVWAEATWPLAVSTGTAQR